MDDKQKEALKNAAAQVGKTAGNLAAKAGKTLNAAVNEMEKRIKDKADLRKPQNTWYSKAAAPVLFEFIFKQLRTYPIAADPNFRWRSVQPMTEYLEIVCEAHWKHPDRASGSWLNPTIPGTESNVHLLLTIEPFETGSAVSVTYSRATSKLLGLQQQDFEIDKLIENTNKIIREACVKLN